MGSVHKFKRPPKNENQFRGYRPQPPSGPGGGRPPRWKLSDWQKSALAWSGLVLVAAGIWAIGKLLGNA
ncbi:MAG: hypothetical protein JWQ16_733 [Novosphingobium sp.]|jgi:hypothetical protein|nr:hypothetical protein [Novosphingobium sp.]